MPPPDVASPRLDWRVILGITVVALGIRVFAAVAFSWRNTDTDEYLAMANAILEGRPYSYLPNGYPLLIALLKRVVGPALLEPALIVANIVLSTATVPMTAWIAATCFSARAAVVAAVLVALWPNQINYTRQILTEPAATFFIVLSVCHLLRRRAFAGGLSAYAAVMLRSTLLPAATLFVAWTWYANGRRTAAIYLLGMVLIAGGEWVLTTRGVIAAPANAGGNLLLATRAPDPGGRNFSLQVFDAESRAHPLRAYVAFAAREPIAFAKLRLQSLWEMWGPWPDGGAPSHPRSALARLAIGIRFVALLAAAAAFATMWRRPELWLLALPIVSLTAVHAAFFSMPRFSFTVEPLVLVLVSGLVAGRPGWLLWRHV